MDPRDIRGEDLDLIIDRMLICSSTTNLTTEPFTNWCLMKINTKLFCPLLCMPIFLILVLLTLAGLQGLAFAEPKAPAYSREGMEKVYQRGIAALNNGDQDDALFWFDVFLSAFPDSELADNAFYWTGEIHYARKDYDLAAKAFKEVLKRFPEGNKAPAAMLKAGLSHLEAGDLAQGANYLRAVLYKFPDTEAARLAEERLRGSGTGK